MTTLLAKSHDTSVAVNRHPDKPVGRLFPNVMAAARGWFRSKVAVELASIIGCDVRSAERYLAGHTTADAEAILKILRSEHGPKMIEVAVADLPAHRQAAFWKEMGKAARRAELLARKAEIERELNDT